MKYILLVPDGAADEPLADLGGKTPLEVARTPYLDDLAKTGLVGSVQVTPLDMYPGSDAANMALLGYDPVRYYTGRGPIEAAAMDIPMDAKDVAFRCSLISTDGISLLDYSAGHITTEEARPLIEAGRQKAVHGRDGPIPRSFVPAHTALERWSRGRKDRAAAREHGQEARGDLPDGR